MEDPLLEYKVNPPLDVVMKEGGDDCVGPDIIYGPMVWITCNFSGKAIPICSNNKGEELYDGS